MKKLVLGIMLMGMAEAINAQNLSFGPTLGFGHSWITSAQDVSFKPGFNVGGTLVYSFVPHWGVGADLKASFREGVKTKFESGSNYVENDISATYLRIPVKVYHFFGKYGDKVRPKLFAGPSVGFLLGGKYKTETKTGDNISSIERDTKDVLKSMDFGFVAGAGANVRMQKNVWLNLDLVYANGLMDITEGNNYNANRNISLNVGLTFPLGTVMPSN